MFEIGSSLREARMRNGYDLAEVEAATKIRTKYLKALEDEQFEVLPAQTYIKGFLRSYAEYLGLDGQLYVDEYNSRYGAEEADEPIVRQRAPRRQSKAHRRVESRVLLLALVGILAATALVLIAWQWGEAEPEGVVRLESRPQPSAPPQTPVQSAAVELILVAVRGNSYVAQLAPGGTVGGFEGTIERGRSQRFRGKTLRLQIARPDNLAARLNGKAVALPRRAQPVVVLVTAKGVRVASRA